MKTIYTADQLISVYGEPKNLQTQPVEQPKGENILKSIAKDVAGTLVVNPVARATEAVTRTLAPNSQAAKGYEMLQQEGQGQDVLGVNVPSITGGARQVTGEALKTASYLFPYGKVAGVAGKALGKIGGNVASGAAGGYLADAGVGLTDPKQTTGEALTPGMGTAIGAAIPLVGPTLRATGRATAKLGSKAVESVIPTSSREAGILQTYKANNPFFKRVADVLKGTEQAPTTAGKTVATEGLMGTKSQIGVQAKRAEQKLWDDVISPRLKASEQAVDLDGFFAKIQDDIITNNPEISRQKSLLNALQSFKDDYAGINSVSLEKLQKLKEGWAEFVPEKFYKGQNIAGNAKQVQALMANEARQTIYSQLGDDVKQAYFDYGNLQGLKKMGQVSMTGQKLKGGTGGLLSELLSQTITPIGTVGGQAVYRLGKGIEFVGNLGAKNLGEALGVNLKFPGDMAVDDISKTVKKAKSLPNKQGGFIKLGQDAKAPMATQANQTTRMTPKTSNIPKSSPKATTKSMGIFEDDKLASTADIGKKFDELAKGTKTTKSSLKGKGVIPETREITPDFSLTGQDAKIQNASIAKYRANPQKLVQDYIKTNGKVVNTDEARKLFKDVGYKGSNAAAVQEASSAVAKDAWEKLLKTSKANDSLIYAGGSGTGKTSAVKNILSKEIADAGAILDGNLSTMKSATARIEESIKAGKYPNIVYVYRDPVDSWVNGVIKRMKGNAEEGGRVVPMSVFLQNHEGSYNVVKNLLNDSANGIKYDVKLVDNSLGKGNQTLLSRTKFDKISYLSNLREELLNKTKELYDKGTITKEEYQALIK